MKIQVRSRRFFHGGWRWQVWYNDRLLGNYEYWENAIRFAVRMAMAGGGK